MDAGSMGIPGTGHITWIFTHVRWEGGDKVVFLSSGIWLDGLGKPSVVSIILER
jgi:hypothetical protein